MKKVNLVIMGAVMISLMSASFAGAEIKKVGYLDLSRIFDAYEKTKEYDKVLQAQYDAYEVERNKKVEQIQEKEGKLSLMKEEEKKKTEDEMRTMINNLQQYDVEQRTDLTKKRDEGIREILLEVEQIVGNYAKQEGYDLILNDRVLIYGGENMDITEKILELLNASYKKK